MGVPRNVLVARLLSCSVPCQKPTPPPSKVRWHATHTLTQSETLEVADLAPEQTCDSTDKPARTGAKRCA